MTRNFAAPNAFSSNNEASTSILFDFTSDLRTIFQFIYFLE